MKIIIAIIYIAAIFFASDIYTFTIIFLINIIIIFFSGIPFIIILKALKPLIFIIAFTFTINIFINTGDTLLIKIGFIEIYLDGLLNAIFFVIRMVSLVSATAVFITYTTSPTMLTDAIERLLSPLKKIKIPVHEFAMMMTLALTFIPTLIDETEKIINAQKARGADFYSGNILKRAKALIPVLIPLIVSAFRRADELATAMECRCYRLGEGRTKMKRLKYAPKDFVALGLSVVLAAAVIALPRIF
jgi:energy-coupling factor transport system permease protein